MEHFFLVFCLLYGMLLTYSMRSALQHLSENDEVHFKRKPLLSLSLYESTEKSEFGVKQENNKVTSGVFTYVT